MKKYCCLLLFLLDSIFCAWGKVRFDDWFVDKTLRVDYVFGGTDSTQELYLSELLSLPRWSGRTVNLDTLCLKGNGQITVKDEQSGVVIYRTSFSSLFQEWQNTQEAQKVRKSFENTFLVPFPKRPIIITLELFNKYRERTAVLTFQVDPKDVLIRKMEDNKSSNVSYRYVCGGSRGNINVVFVPEGYTKEEMHTFYDDVNKACSALFQHEPFKKFKNRFNIIAVEAPSEDSGVSVPQQGIWRRTILDSHFDTFYSDRYLTTLHLTRLHDLLATVPYEHIVILANTNTYGGGGIFNSYTLTTTHNQQFQPVVVHEFGHSFGGLADEYYYDDEYSPNYVKDVEPYEPNITTLANFAEKWESILPKRTVIPTPANNKGKEIYTKIGVYEGAGYQSKGVYRAFQECRMKINEAPEFCLVCQQALERIIRFYTENLQ